MVAPRRAFLGMLGAYLLIVLYVMQIKKKVQAAPRKRCSATIIVDAGSTGSRGYVYTIKNHAVQVRVGAKINPGLATFVNKSAKAAEYLLPLIKSATSLIPAESVAQLHRSDISNCISFALRATGGMRLVEKAAQKVLYRQLWRDLDASMQLNSHITISKNSFNTISGTEEGFYILLACNYLMGRINDRLIRISAKPLLGTLDMGGSSVQITYPKLSKKREKRQSLAASAVSINSYAIGSEVQQAKVRLAIFKRTRRNTLSQYTSPCRNSGYVFQFSPTGSVFGDKDGTSTVQMVGASNVDKCKTLIRDSLRSSVTGLTLPPTDGSLHYFALEKFFYAAEFAKGALGERSEIYRNWPNPSVRQLQTAADDFCQMSWVEVKRELPPELYSENDEEQLGGRCFDLQYVVAILNALRFPIDSKLVTFAKKVRGKEISWTLGSHLSDDVQHGTGESQSRI